MKKSRIAMLLAAIMTVNVCTPVIAAEETDTLNSADTAVAVESTTESAPAEITADDTMREEIVKEVILDTIIETATATENNAETTAASEEETAPVEAAAEEVEASDADVATDDTVTEDTASDTDAKTDVTADTTEAEVTETTDAVTDDTATDAVATEAPTENSAVVKTPAETETTGTTEVKVKAVENNETNDTAVETDENGTETYSATRTPEADQIADKFTGDYQFDMSSEKQMEQNEKGEYVPTQAELENALKAVNFIRYTAGLPEVTMSEAYNKLAQAAAKLMKTNDVLSHYPTKPEGYDEQEYKDGYKGASHSNISQGFVNLAESIINGYLNDGDADNLSELGHRRWVLSPKMIETGFGMENSDSSYAAMYVIGEMSDYEVEDFTAWPATNMPIELMTDHYSIYTGKTDSAYPWSVSLGTNYQIADPKGVTVTLTDKNGKAWNFDFASSNEAGNYFNVSLDKGYDQSNIIIFRPDPTSISYAAGDSFTVTVKGIKDAAGNDTELTYPVNMFKASEGPKNDDTDNEDPKDEEDKKDPAEEEKPDTKPEDGDHKDDDDSDTKPDEIQKPENGNKPSDKPSVDDDKIDIDGTKPSTKPSDDKNNGSHKNPTRPSDTDKKDDQDNTVIDKNDDKKSDQKTPGIVGESVVRPNASANMAGETEARITIPVQTEDGATIIYTIPREKKSPQTGEF